MKHDLEGHPDAMLWLAQSKAAIAAYEEARKRRERVRAFIATVITIIAAVTVISLVWKHDLCG